MTKDINEACTGLSIAFPNLVFNPACIGRNAPDNNAMMIQVIFILPVFYRNNYQLNIYPVPVPVSAKK
jgi:hypothetical protein